MSFILDALRKSETDRQLQGSAEFSGVPAGSGSPSLPRWLWILGALLAVNLVVLLGLLFWPSDKSASLQSIPVTEARTRVANGPSFEERVAAARQIEPARQESAVAPRQEVRTPPPAAATELAPSAPPNSGILPTIHTLRANGTIALPELHLDIHVYSEIPADRFVFINMSKQREKSQLTEGPVVKEITPEGVVLDHRGTSFLLPRE